MQTCLTLSFLLDTFHVIMLHFGSMFFNLTLVNICMFTITSVASERHGLSIEMDGGGIVRYLVIITLPDIRIQLLYGEFRKAFQLGFNRKCICNESAKNAKSAVNRKEDKYACEMRTF